MQSRPRGPDKAELGRIRKADGNLLGFPRVAAGKAVGNSAMMDQDSNQTIKSRCGFDNGPFAWALPPASEKATPTKQITDFTESET